MLFLQKYKNVLFIVIKKIKGGLAIQLNSVQVRYTNLRRIS